MPPPTRRPMPPNPMAKPINKIGMTKLGDPGVASAPMPSSQIGTGQNRSEIYTYMTSAPRIGESTPVLYTGDRLWTKITLTLETSGPVAVGVKSQITPVLQGSGVLLATGEQMPFTIAKGSKLYIASTSVNRVKVVVEPLPWLEQITAYLTAMPQSLATSLKSVLSELFKR